MGKRKRKKRIRTAWIFLSIYIYTAFAMSLIKVSYCAFNLDNFSLRETFIFTLVLIPIALGLGIYYGENFKKAKKIFEMVKGLLLAIPIILIMMTISGLIYKNIKINRITEENERLYEQYSYYTDFNVVESGYNYRIDDNTGYVYHIDYETNQLIEKKPTYFYNLEGDYKYDIYKTEKGYAIIHGTTTYFTKELKKDSKVYQIDFPITKIRKNYKLNEYYIIEGNRFNKINSEYSSEQKNNFLFLYKKANEVFYTKEKMYDIRIQIQNNFAEYTEAEYRENYVYLIVDNKETKIKFTFDKNLNVIYSKEEI